MVKSRWLLRAFKRDDFGCISNEITDAKTENVYTKKQVEQACDEYKRAIARDYNVSENNINVTYEPIPGTEVEVKLVDISMLTSFGRRYFNSVDLDSLFVRDDGYFELITIDDDRVHRIKKDAVLEYTIKDHVNEKEENSEK